ncbi:SCO family protein [Methylobacillus gramineus]|uniref:SCO family protein n=1 Tax=Methylobacillus gramineus TaxID=755169 RepID=UPI001CFF7FCE|nr:SCO family protein [Methylobacillus gramineus]MCB5185072.1 SCO family protein [Methylobacillus gramineus]
MRASIFILLSLLLIGCGQGKQEMQLYGADVTGTEISGAFELRDHTGKVRHLEDFQGKLVAVFFGYTHCPDVCPTTMLALADAMKLLGKQAEQVQVLFVTVDPERDTQQVLAQYVPSFYPGFIGLYGTEAQLKSTASHYRVMYAKQAVEGGGAYTVDHSAGVYLFDRNGKIRAYLKHDQSPEQLAHDITQFF